MGNGRLITELRTFAVSSPWTKEFPSAFPEKNPSDASLAIGQSAPWLRPYHYFGGRGLPARSSVQFCGERGDYKQTQQKHQDFIGWSPGIQYHSHPKWFHRFLLGGLGYLGMTFGGNFPKLNQVADLLADPVLPEIPMVHHASVKAPSFVSSDHL